VVLCACTFGIGIGLHGQVGSSACREQRNIQEGPSVIFVNVSTGFFAGVRLGFGSDCMGRWAAARAGSSATFRKFPLSSSSMCRQASLRVYIWALHRTAWAGGQQCQTQDAQQAFSANRLSSLVCMQYSWKQACGKRQWPCVWHDSACSLPVPSISAKLFIDSHSVEA
jgi:hypothetical protein